MKSDQYGHRYCSSDYLCELLYKNPDIKIEQFLVEDPDSYNKAVKSFHADLPILKRYTDLFRDRDAFASIDEFDLENQSKWFMPDSYKTMQIDEFILSKCQTEEEFVRVQDELLLFKKDSYSIYLNF